MNYSPYRQRFNSGVSSSSVSPSSSSPMSNKTLTTMMVNELDSNNKDDKDNNNKNERLTTSALSTSANRIPTTSSATTTNTTTITPRSSSSIINNRNQIINKPTTTAPSPFVSSNRNTLKSENFPMISSNWENTKYSDYIGFRSYYMRLKSRNFIFFNLLLLSLSLSGHYYLYLNLELIKQMDNMFIYYYLPLSCLTFIIGFTLYNIYLHFKQVPEIKLTEDERILYDWPNNFPSSPISPLSPVKPHQQPLQQSISTPKNNNNNNNLQDLNSVSPIQLNLSLSGKQQQTPVEETYVSSFNSYNQFIKAQQLSSPSPSSGGGGGGLNSSQLNNSYLGGTGSINKSFEEIERERINQNFKGRLQSNLTDFSFEFNGNDSILGRKKQQQDKEQEDHDGGYNRQSLTNEYQSMSSLNNTNEPIIHSIVQKPIINTGDVKVNSQKVKTFEQTVSGKVELWNKFIRDKNFYAISSCATKCKRWFTINILSQLVEPAQLFLSLAKEDDQQQQQQLQEELSKPFTKQQYDNMMNGTPLDIIKAVLKNVVYNLNLINDVHHKKECVYICQRIIELSRDKHVFLDFNKGGQGWIANELPTDEQLLFCLFVAYMDYKLYRDVTAPNPDIPFSSKYIKHEDSKFINQYSVMISIAYKRPLHCDILIPKGIYSQNNVIWDISPGFDNLFFSIVLFFYNVIQNQNGYIEGFNVDLLNVGSFIQPLFNPNTYNYINNNNNSDDDEFY